MPTYDYACEKCGKRFSRTESMEVHARKQKAKCPKCDSKRVVRVYSGFFAKTATKS